MQQPQPEDDDDDEADRAAAELMCVRAALSTTFCAASPCSRHLALANRDAAPDSTPPPVHPRRASVQRGFAKARQAGIPAAKRLMKELQSIRKADPESHGFDVSLPDESDLYTWHASFFGFEKGARTEPCARGDIACHR